MHCHLLPEVDDGAKDTQDALECIALLKAMGYRGAVLTPHIYRDVFDNNEAFLAGRFESFRAEVAQQIDGFELKLGAEYLLDDQFLDKLYDRSDQLLTFGEGRRCLLIEFSGLVEPLNSTELLDECRRQGIEPIIAHIERYPFVIDDHDLRKVLTWQQHGAMLQVNIGSLAGQYGSAIQRTARHLWRRSCVDLLGTDMHRPRGARRFLEKAWDYIQKKPNGFNTDRHRLLFETDPG